MMKKILASALCCALAFVASVSFSGRDLQDDAKSLFEPIPTKAPDLRGNPANPAKVKLGKILYFDPRLSASHLISCNTCHNLGLAGADLQETSVGHGWQRGPRNAPTVLNAVFNVAQFWDGRAMDLAEQAKGPVQASVEMNNKPGHVIKTLKSMPGYVELFKKAFPDETDPVTFNNVAKAIEVFEATLLTPHSPLDRFMAGDSQALTEVQKEGLGLFIDRGCSSCHYGVNLGGKGYYPFGVVAAPKDEVRPPGDLGRYQLTNTSGDRYVFKSPILRNVALTPPYFHSGKVWNLLDAVKIMGSAQLGYEVTDDEAEKIVEFLGALTGDQPQVRYPILPPNSNTTPRPILTFGK